MRITQNNFYNSFVADQQSIKQQLDRLNQQLSSGLKIKYGYEDPQIFTDTLRLDYEETTLTQAVNVSTDAQNFANNTDSVMFQFTDALTRFKTLLIQASNGANSDGNYFAISNEMKSLKEHMINLSNSSINGRYLFSGTALDTKPVDSEGVYHGNDGLMKAVVGAGVEVPYNIPGSDLFLGEDLNFSRKVTTNIPLKDVQTDTAVSLESTIADFTGKSDDYNFFIRGRNGDGSVFENSFTMTADKTVAELLGEIESSFTPESVDVTLENGYIQITDRQKGRSLLDFHLYAENSVDSSPVPFMESGFAGADASSYDNIDFAKSDSVTLTGNYSQIVKSDNSYAVRGTLLSDVAGASLAGGSLELSGTDRNGNAFSYTLDLDNPTDIFSNQINNSDGTPADSSTLTYGQLLDAVAVAVSGISDQGSFDANVAEARKWVDVYLDSKGRIVVEDKVGTDTQITFNMHDSKSGFATPGASALVFNANNALEIDDPKHDLFESLDLAIEAVESGMLYPEGTSAVNPRNPGIENALEKIDHVLEHVGKEHTRIGAMSNSLNYSVERNETLKLNVQTLRSEILDTDIGEATVKLNQLSLNYQALLASVAKVQNLSLVNYL
ncbi:flagellar hook-associated protein FlgL [Hydrogenimonas sp.]|nr:flagellar hook-associated protein FlgL [Hydrogenimonas sp.]